MRYIDELIKRKNNLSNIKDDIEKAVNLIEDCHKKGNKILICGNGGSASDSAHIMGELVKSFKKIRKQDKNLFDNLKKICEKSEYDEYEKNIENGMSVIDLTAFTSYNTAFSNDKSYDYVYANSVASLGKDGDIFIAISTSGDSQSIVAASKVAKAKNMKVILLSGKNGGKIKNISDVSIISPEKETYLIQEDHISIYHAICLQLEEDLF